MPTKQDMDFAKILVSKQYLKAAAAQKYLDEIDIIRISRKNVTLEQLLLDNGVIEHKDLKILRPPKRRKVHCGKCKTMYSVQEQDIGRRFKCKSCGIFVTVPRPGQTRAIAIQDLVKLEKLKKLKRLQQKKEQKKIAQISDKSNAKSGSPITKAKKKDQGITIPPKVNEQGKTITQPENKEQKSIAIPPKLVQQDIFSVDLDDHEGITIKPATDNEETIIIESKADEYKKDPESQPANIEFDGDLLDLSEVFGIKKDSNTLAKEQSKSNEDLPENDEIFNKSETIITSDSFEDDKIKQDANKIIEKEIEEKAKIGISEKETRQEDETFDSHELKLAMMFEADEERKVNENKQNIDKTALKEIEEKKSEVTSSQSPKPKLTDKDDGDVQVQKEVKEEKENKKTETVYKSSKQAKDEIPDFQEPELIMMLGLDGDSNDDDDNEEQDTAEAVREKVKEEKPEPSKTSKQVRDEIPDFQEPELTMMLGLDGDSNDDDDNEEQDVAEPVREKVKEEKPEPSKTSKQVRDEIPDFQESELTMMLGLDEDNEEQDTAEVLREKVKEEKSEPYKTSKQARDKVPDFYESELMIGLDETKNEKQGKDEDSKTFNTFDSTLEKLQDEHVKIIRVLAKGKFDIVYEAVINDNRLAIRVLNKNVTEDILINKIIQDIITTSKLSHENIIKIYQPYIYNENVAYTMEYIPKGESLQLMWPRMCSNEESTVKLGLQILSTLDYAHGKGVTHKYINWDNVLIQDKKIYLRDFGLTSLHYKISILSLQENDFSPIFMSPEQVIHIVEKQNSDIVQNVDVRSDIYSLGVLLYWMISGKLPYDETEEHDSLIDQIIKLDPIPLAELEEEISIGLSYIVMKAMSKDPDKRYFSASDMAEDMEQLL